MLFIFRFAQFKMQTGLCWKALTHKKVFYDGVNSPFKSCPFSCSLHHSSSRGEMRGCSLSTRQQKRVISSRPVSSAVESAGGYHLIIPVDKSSSQLSHWDMLFIRTLKETSSKLISIVNRGRKRRQEKDEGGMTPSLASADLAICIFGFIYAKSF